MDTYKKDFENAIEMIDWQNKMLKQQADEIESLRKQLKVACSKLMDMNLKGEPVLYINEETLRGGNGGDTFWDTEVSWWPEDGFVPLYEK